MGSKRFKNDLLRRYDVISTKFERFDLNPGNVLYLSNSIDVQLVLLLKYQ